MSLANFPFIPKTIAELERGHCWSIALLDGRYACGIVLEVDITDPLMLEPMPKAFLAGLLDWVGDGPPDQETLDQVETTPQLLKHGFAGLLAVTEGGGQVGGYWDLTERPIEVPETVTHRQGGPPWVVSGSERVRVASRTEAVELPTMKTLGLTSLESFANDRWCQSEQ